VSDPEGRPSRVTAAQLAVWRERFDRSALQAEGNGEIIIALLDALDAAGVRIADLERLRARGLELEHTAGRVEGMQAGVASLHREVEHWREARRAAIAAGEILKAEVDRLRAGLISLRREGNEACCCGWTAKIDALLGVGTPVETTPELDDEHRLVGRARKDRDDA